MKVHGAATRTDSWGEAMDVPAVLEALGHQPGEAVVLLRLFLVAADQVTGDQRLVSTFVRTLGMPPSMVGPEVSIALELLGERRVFRPTGVVWDEAHRACILEITWVVADRTGAAGAWHAGAADRRADAGGRRTTAVAASHDLPLPRIPRLRCR